MPFYTLETMKKSLGEADSAIEMFSTMGEFMKIAFVVQADAVGPPLHDHPNEEQFNLVLEGEMHVILGDEERVVGPGTIIHVPRNTPHRSRSVNGTAKFLLVKSPAGDGRMDADYQKAENAEQAERTFPKAK